MYGIRDAGVTYIACTSIWDPNEAPSSMSAAGQADKTRPDRSDPMQCTTKFDNIFSLHGHGIARQDVRFDSVPQYALATSGTSSSSPTCVASYLQGANLCPLEGRMHLHHGR